MEVTNTTNPATYGDTRTATEIAQTQIDSARKLAAGNPDMLAALDREAAQRGVK
jgi:hypothetical protein